MEYLEAVVPSVAARRRIERIPRQIIAVAEAQLVTSCAFQVQVALKLHALSNKGVQLGWP